MSSTQQTTFTSESHKHALPSEEIEKSGVYSESAHDYNVSEGLTGEETISPSEPVVREEIIATETTYTAPPTGETYTGGTGETTYTAPPTAETTTTTPRKPGLGAKIKGLFASKHHKDREMAPATTTTTETHEKKGLFSGKKRKHHVHEKHVATTTERQHELHTERHEEYGGGVLGSSGAPDIVTPEDEGVLAGHGAGYEEGEVSNTQLERPTRETWTKEKRAAPVSGSESYTIVDEPTEGVTRAGKTGEGRTGWTGTTTTTTEEKSTFPTKTTTEKDVSGAGWTGSERTIGLTGTHHEKETTTPEEPGTLTSTQGILHEDIHEKEATPTTHEGSHVTRTVKRSSSPLILHFESEAIVHSQEEFDKLPKERRIDVQQLLREQAKAGSATEEKSTFPTRTTTEKDVSAGKDYAE